MKWQNNSGGRDDDNGDKGYNEKGNSSSYTRKVMSIIIIAGDGDGFLLYMCVVSIISIINIITVIIIVILLL